MHVYVVFAHPSRESFTAKVLRAFVRGLHDGGHTVEIGDLYAMDFKADMDIKQYKREMGADTEAPLPPDVEREQRKIERAQGLAFVYPVWWADCPAKLKGWFDRVFTHGYAYNRDKSSRKPVKLRIEKAVALCPAGQPIERLEETRVAHGMRYVMLNDRLGGSGIREASMEILAGMGGDDGTNEKLNLERAYETGKTFACPKVACG